MKSKGTKEHVSDANALAVMGIGLAAAMFFPISLPAALLACLAGATVAKVGSRRQIVDHLDEVADQACGRVVSDLARLNLPGDVTYTEWKDGLPISRIHRYEP